MPFDPTLPLAGSKIRSAELRSQFTGLDDKITTQTARVDGAFAALDWSNGAAKLPDYTTIANPVLGNVAFDYSGGYLMFYDGDDWQTVRPS